MKQVNLDNNFNVGTPTSENIEYAFKNLLFYLNASSCLDIYSEQRNSFEQILYKVNGILKIYVNNKNLSVIDEELLQDVKYDLIDLDDETKTLNSYYAEWSLMWLEVIMSLRMSEIKIGSIING